MAVAIDNPVAQQTSSGTNVSFSYTSSGGADRLLLAQTKLNGAGQANSGTYAGAALSVVDTTGSVRMFSKTAPATGANTLAFALSTYGNLFVNAANFTGVDQTTPLGAAVTNSGASSAPNSGSVTCPANGMVFGGVGTNYTTSAPGAGSGTTLAGSVRSGGTGHSKAAGYRTNTGAIVFTLGSTPNWDVQAYPINPVSAAGVTGTIAATNASDTASAAGTPVLVGTIAKTNGNDTASAFGWPVNVGTIAKTNGSDSAAASGSPVNVGTVTATNGNDSAALAGSVGSNISGTIAATNASDTAAAAGTPVNVGTVAATIAGDTAALVGKLVLVGTIAVTNGNDTAALSGAAGAVVGTIAATEGRDGCVAAGISGNPVVEQPTGGYVHYPRTRTDEQLREARIKFGVIPLQVKKAAKRVAKRVIAEHETPIEYFHEHRPQVEAQLRAELAKLVEPPQWTNAFIEQIGIVLERLARDHAQDEEDEEMLLLLY